VTALLFTLGKYLIGVYLSNATVASTYGAAGSLVALLLWIYYSAQIFFFGAEFTQVYANRFGSKITHDKQVLTEKFDIQARLGISEKSDQEQSIEKEKRKAQPEIYEPAASSERRFQKLPQEQPSLMAFSALLATLVGFVVGLLFYKSTSLRS